MHVLMPLLGTLFPDVPPDPLSPPQSFTPVAPEVQGSLRSCKNTVTRYRALIQTEILHGE